MRRKPNLKLKEYLLKVAKDYNIKELVKKVNKKFKENYEENELRKYLVRNKIEYKYECENRSNPMGLNVPIGSEYVKDDGMILVKVGSNKWKYKQRIIYEQYYNVELKDDEYIIFLNQNRNDFRIKNLMKVSRKESAYISNMGIFSTNSKVTKVAIDLAKLKIKEKEMEREYGKKGFRKNRKRKYDSVS